MHNPPLSSNIVRVLLDSLIFVAEALGKIIVAVVPKSKTARCGVTQKGSKIG